MYAMAAESLLRWPICNTRVNPPGRSLYLSASSVKSLLTIASVRTTAAALRRARRLPSLAKVTTRSATRRSSFAFATVVWMRSCSMSCVTMVRIMAHLWLASLPSLRKCRPCFILRPSRAVPFWLET